MEAVSAKELKVGGVLVLKPPCIGGFYWSASASWAMYRGQHPRLSGESIFFAISGELSKLYFVRRVGLLFLLA